MKKITIILVLLIAIIPLSTVNIAYAAELNENSYEESIYLEEGNTYINGNLITEYDQRNLTEGSYDNYTYDLTSTLASINPQEGYEVQSIILKINTSMHYSDNNIIFETNDSALTEHLFTYGDLRDYQYWLIIDVDTYQDFTTHESGFTFSMPSGVTPSYNVRISSAFIEVTYIKSLGEYTDINYCDTDYSLLPDTNEEFLDIISTEEYNKETHSFKMSYAYDTELYCFNVAIPEEIYYNTYSSEWNENIRFTDIAANQMSIATSSSGEQVLYIQPDNIANNKPQEVEGSESYDVVGFITINLTTMEYKVINKLELVGVVNKEANRYAALYCFFPAKVQDLLSITVSYDYRINKILGQEGEWQSITNTYVDGESYDGNLPSWMWWVSGGWAVLSTITNNYVYDIEDVILNITSSDIPDDVIDTYTTELGGSTSDFDELQLYKVYLGQYQDGLLTALGDENAYDIDELVILEILYEYKGIVYTASTEEIESIVANPDLSSPGITIDFLEDIELPWYIYVGFGCVLIWVASKLELDKKPGLVLIIIAAILYILYKLGVI